MSKFYFFQTTGGEEKWKVTPVADIGDLEPPPMFVTALSLDKLPADNATREELNEIRYSGELYFDFDSKDVVSCAEEVQLFLSKIEDRGVNLDYVKLWASGGKGFHITIPQQVFMTKVPRAGVQFLPQIYKEVAFSLATPSMDLVVYTARKGRMFRQENVLRPNGLYKVRIEREELEGMTEQKYKTLCSKPGGYPGIPPNVTLSYEFLALYDEARAKVTKAYQAKKKLKTPTLPSKMPSFDNLLKGEGVKPDAGFQTIAMQSAITAHARGMTEQQLVEASVGLCTKHQSEGGGRYGTPEKRKAELVRMYQYMDDNPCYTYSPQALMSLLSHAAPDLHGLDMTKEEFDANMVSPTAEDLEKTNTKDDEFSYGKVVMTKSGTYALTEDGNRKLSAMSFENVCELTSTETGTIAAFEADVYVAGKRIGRQALELSNMDSVAGFNAVAMRYGQTFIGTDAHAKGAYLKTVSIARASGNRMYVLNREGIDYIAINQHEDPELQEKFLVWADNKGVVAPDWVTDKGIKFKFMGDPDPRGMLQTNLSNAPDVATWLEDVTEVSTPSGIKDVPPTIDIVNNRVLLQRFLDGLLFCQSPEIVGRLLGWFTACNYRMLFNSLYDKFPILHIAGAGGQGKCLGIDTPVLMADGTTKMVQDVKVGEYLLTPSGGRNIVTSTCSGKETMYKVTPVKGEPYYCNESHILSLRRCDAGAITLSDGSIVSKDVDILNVSVKTFLETPKIKRLFCGWRLHEPVEFYRETEVLPVDPYWLGAWLGDGKSDDVAIYKPACKMTEWLHGYAASLGMRVSMYDRLGGCPGWAIVGRDDNPLRAFVKSMGKGKFVPDEYLYGNKEVRAKVLAGLMDTDGSLAYSGFDYISISSELAEQVCFLARSLGLAAYMKECTKGIKSYGFVGTYHRVHISGDCDIIPTLDKIAPPRKQIKRVTVTGISVESVGMGDYYGFSLDGDHLFMLGDFTVTHNSEMTMLFSAMHYYTSDAIILTPGSTVFALSQSVSASASIPVVLDEFKQEAMPHEMYGRLKLLIRDLYNNRQLERGGGNRDNNNFRALTKTQMSAPLVFIAESMETEPALMERVVFITMVKPPENILVKYREHFGFARDHKKLLGILGKYLAADTVKNYSEKRLAAEFNYILGESKNRFLGKSLEAALLGDSKTNKVVEARDRTVYNYAVVKFGLIRFESVVNTIFGDRYKEVFEQMHEPLCKSMLQLMDQTTPEWIKVLNTMQDMAAQDASALSYIKEGKDFKHVVYADCDCIEIYARNVYHKYRYYMVGAQMKPLFPNEGGFIHAIEAANACIAINTNHELKTPGGSHIFRLDRLLPQGFKDFGAD